MAQQEPSDASSSQRQRHRRDPLLPPEVVAVLVPSLQVGAGAGTVGLFVGAASGIARSTTPALFSLVSGAQWFVLGSTYYAGRRTVINAWGGDEKLSRLDKVKASAIAGGFAGLSGSLLRGPKNIVPAVLMFSVFGAGGQAVANATAGSRQSSKPKTSWLASKWSPLKPLTDQEYKHMLEEKLLKLDAELAVIDDKIAAVRAEERQKAPDGDNGPYERS